VRGRASFAAWRERHPDGARALGTVPADVNDVRLLDDFRPAGALRHRAAPSGDYDLELFEITMPTP
jgi:hypothetical protein